MKAGGKIPEIELSPLDKIRYAEAQSTRQLAAARVKADELIENTKGEAKKKIAAAHQIGAREGSILKKEMLSKAEDEAQAILEQGKKYADLLELKGKQFMSQAVDQVTDIILGLEPGGKQDEY